MNTKLCYKNKFAFQRSSDFRSSTLGYFTTDNIVKKSTRHIKS